MNRKTRVLTLSALFSALTVVTLYFASVWPTGQLGLTAAASLFTAAAITEAGISSGVYVFVIGSALGMLILPNKTSPLLYVLFFGYYPVLKSLIERIGNVLLQWALKLVVFNAALTIIWFLLRELIFNSEISAPAAIMYPVGNAVFVLFDYGYSKLIWFYINRVSKIRKQ